MFILLLCSAGMSTSLLVTRMQEAASQQGIECRIEAHPFADVDQYKDEADVIMLGPQVRFQFNKMKTTCAPKPVAVISPRDYGMMDGPKVLAEAIKLINK